jgi:hypothetical protein
LYLLSGLRARASAYGHYLLYLTRRDIDRPESLRELLVREEAQP